MDLLKLEYSKVGLLILKYSTLISSHRVLYERDSMTDICDLIAAKVAREVTGNGQCLGFETWVSTNKKHKVPSTTGV